MRGEGGRLSLFNESTNNPPAAAPRSISPLRSAMSVSSTEHEPTRESLNYFFMQRGNDLAEERLD